MVPIYLLILFIGRQPERMISRMFLLAYTIVFSIPFMSLMVLFPKDFSVVDIVYLGSIIS